MTASSLDSVESIRDRFDEWGYVADEALATSVFLVLKLGRPLLLEGAAGVGKTQLAHVLAETLGARLIRLQCYEGLDVHSAMYEWDYQRQLLAIRLQDAEHLSLEEKEAHIFSEDFLLERPLLQAITERDAPPVLLIDEIDRADEAFEAFLLELLSQFQITIPEFGTIRATHVPYVILTSNRTRDLSDALKRRCLFHWIDYPDFEKEVTIVKKRVENIEHVLAEQVVRFVQAVRIQRLEKPPGIAETLDWANALIALGKKTIDPAVFRTTAGALLKSNQDYEMLEQIGIDGLLAKP
jgi:MoxR-like ATPase